MIGSNQVSNVASSVVTPVALSGFKTPLLNEFEGASAAYSLRRLKSWEDGSKVVRVRRATDNAEQDFSSVDVANGTMANWVNAYTDLPLDVDSGAAAAYSLRNLKASGTDVQPTGDSPRPVENNTDLFLPDEFPVTLQRNNEEYFIKETGADWFANYSGATLYVSPSGSDTTGDGSSSNPYQSLNTVISNASDNDIISMSAGIYAMPTLAISKDLAFVCPSGKAYIGTFNDLSSAQIDAIDYSGTVLHNVDDVVAGETFKGWIRTDGTLVGGVRGSAVSETNGQAIDYQNFGVMSVFADSTSADFSTGTSETLQELVDAGSVLAWSDADTDSFRVNTDTSVYIGENITLASYGTDVVAGIGSANLILDGCEIYGGSANCVSHPDSGSVLMFNTLAAGSSEDNIDYRGTVVAVESNITSNWCNTGVSDNTSTGHDSCKVLRVGGTYRGGSRTIHDVVDTKAYVYSCTIGDAVSNDKTLLLSGFSTIGSETCTLGYGDITFIDTFNDGGLTNLYIDSESTATNSELNQGWSYFTAGKYVVQVRRSSDDAVKSFTAAEVADGTLESWVGAGNDGFVKTWYDQSGNTNDATQTTDASQPKIVSAGSLVTGGLDFDGTQFLGANGIASSVTGTDKPYSTFAVSKTNTTATQYLLGMGGAASSTPIKNILYHSGGNFGVQQRDDANVLKQNLSASSYSTGTTYLTSTTSSGTVIDFSKDGSLDVDDFDVDVGLLTIDKVNIGAKANGDADPLNGSISELIIYNTDQSDNRTAIEANIGDYYSIDLPAGVDSGNNEVDGFVTKWYDQSGNGNDAVQTTAAKQPKIVENGTYLGEIDFDGVDDVFDIDFGADLTQANSLFMVHQSDTLTDSSNEFFDSAGGAAPRTLFDQGGTNYRLFSGTVADTGVALTTDQSLVSAIYNGTSSLFAKNGTATGALNAGTAAINQNSTLGSASGSFYDGTMGEFIVYNSDQSANRTAIETNIADEYGITLS